MPVELKRAHIRPHLKKPSLDPDILNNYLPVSNLPFVSKIIEKVVDTRLEHLRGNNLHQPSQSAYRRQHSTETALIKIQSDILQALDNGRVAALVLLDLGGVRHYRSLHPYRASGTHTRYFLRCPEMDGILLARTKPTSHHW